MEKHFRIILLLEMEKCFNSGIPNAAAIKGVCEKRVFSEIELSSCHDYEIHQLPQHLVETLNCLRDNLVIDFQ